MFPFLIMIFTRAKASGDRIGEVLETEGDEREEGIISDRLSGRIEFQHVSFRYPEMDREALRNVSFSAKPRETIAILGATGSGKSTLFQLIPRLYQPDSGSIYIDEKPIHDFPAERLRKQIGYVPQEVLLFSGTIKENIAWGKENASLDEIMEAAKHAQIHETIIKLPNGYDTVLGQRGVNLSGGQKQRISIARALIRKPAILLLDDSTSALDLQTEAKLLEAISTYECTTLIITQKITTAMKADEILLLEDGELIEKGTHSELLSESRLYKRIYESQFGRGGERMLKDICKPFQYPKLPIDKKEGAKKRAKAKDAKGTLKRIWSYLAERKGLLILVMLMVVISSIFGLLGPFVIGKAIGPFYRRENGQRIDSRFASSARHLHDSVPVALVSKLLDDYDLARHGFQNEKRVVHPSA